jgi:tetratricopeptide (TPR) repeat protein
MNVDTYHKVLAAHEALDANRLEEAEQLITQAETELPTISTTKDKKIIQANLGAVCIDLGMITANADLVKQGVEYSETLLLDTLAEDRTANQYYNTANGYLTLAEFNFTASLQAGCIDKSYRKAKGYFEQAIAILKSQGPKSDPCLCQQVLVNYANCLNFVAYRKIEAITFYEQALSINPQMAMALANKAEALYELAWLTHGYRHRFVLEAQHLFDQALEQDLSFHARQHFEAQRTTVQRFIDAHKEIEPEDIAVSEPISEFHHFLSNFCLKHQLFLTPTSILGDTTSSVAGDPMFISRMITTIDDYDKFERYITFLNEIKLDYVLARYQLVQSQFKSEFIDAANEDVETYHTLDYALYSVYIQMLKTSLRLATDILDKVAFFVYDYYSVKDLDQRSVDFKTLWSPKKTPLKLRSPLAGKQNPFLFALLDLSLDLRENGPLDWIYDRRNALTHRFLVVHDMLRTKHQQNPDIPRIELDALLQEAINTMQVARLAVMYLVMLVDYEEGLNRAEERYVRYSNPPTSGRSRWVPPLGE